MRLSDQRGFFGLGGTKPQKTYTLSEGSDITGAGIRYSTTKDTLDALKGDEDVTVEAATSAGAYANWILPVTPTITDQVVAEDETYYAVVYMETADGTYNSDVAAVRLSELDYAMSAISYLGIEKSALRGKLCAVTFVANGGEGAMEPQGIVRNQATALKSNTFTRSDKVFGGWNTAAEVYSQTPFATSDICSGTRIDTWIG